MRLWLHVRDYDDVRLQLCLAGLWLRDPADEPERPHRSRWRPVPATRSLTHDERVLDDLMREVPVIVDA
jgi:hypothetical protein